jgi:hypothetical protein
MSYPKKKGYSVPGPSREAAEEVEERATSRERSIYELLKGCLPCGLTVFEIAARVGLGHWQVSPRISTLHRAGLVEQTGERRDGLSRVKVNCWRAVVIE